MEFGEKERNHVPLVNHHLFASTGNYHRRGTEQFALGFEVFHLELSDVDCSSDFIFLCDRRGNCGGLELAKIGEKIVCWKENEQRDQ